MSLFNAYMALSGAVDAEVCRDERMSRRTTWRIGGPAALLVKPNDLAALKRTVEVLDREGVEWVVLGKGSNVLVSDEGYDGCVILLGRDFSRIGADPGDGTITAGAGAVLSRLVNEAYKRGLSGLECCAGSPGTVGGAVSMDAGSRDEWIGRAVRSLIVLRPDGSLHRYPGDEVEWGYRYTSIPPNELILEATFSLEPARKDEISRDMERRLARRRRSQPLGKPSCGSVFRNPPDQSVGRLLEDCGLKGYSVGRAEVSEVHANFIVNNGGATAEDVLSVMREMFRRVRDKHGIELRPEVKFLGPFS